MGPVPEQITTKADVDEADDDANCVKVGYPDICVCDQW